MLERQKNLVRINARINGKKIWVNKLAKGADSIIGIGSMVPHTTTGLSGGGKIILLGSCGKNISEDMHWKALDFRTEDLLGKYNNPMRKIVDHVTRKTGLKFIANTIFDRKGRLFGIVAGEPVKAHKKGS